MDERWAKFWMTVAVMGWVGFIAGPAGPRLEWGSLADWMAGGATLAAVVVALRTAEQQGKLALQIAGDDREAANQRERSAEIRLLKSVLLVVNQGIQTIIRSNRKLATLEDRRHEFAISVFQSAAIRLVSETLDQVRLDQLPTTTSVDLLMSAKASWIGVVEKLAAAAGEWTTIELGGQLADTDWLEQVSDRLADEIVRLGGRGDTYEDIGVQLSIGMAEARARAADPH